MEKLKLNKVVGLNIPGTIMKLKHRLQHEGFDLRYVGGCVRDLLIDRTPKDFDLCTDALPQEVMKWAESFEGVKAYPTGIDHGTVTVVGPEGEPYEITTLRIDTETDGRHAKVQFTDSWEEDAKRRDLTINALYMSVDSDNPTFYDYVGGMSDLENRVIRFVGNAEDRVKEDYLRILRYFRFASRFEALYDVSSLRACSDHAKGLSQISEERIAAEMLKILGSSAKSVPQVLRAMSVTGVLGAIGIDGDFDDDDMLEFCIDSENPLTRLVGMCLLTRQDPTFIASEWKLSNADKAFVTYLWKETFDANFPYTYDLVIKGKPKAWVAERIRLEGHIEYLNDLEYEEIPKFPVNGHDLMAMGIKGKQIGTMLDNLKESWYWNGMTNTKEELINSVTGL